MSPCPIKKGHFETQRVTLSRAINTVPLSVVKKKTFETPLTGYSSKRVITNAIYMTAEVQKLL